MPERFGDDDPSCVWVGEATLFCTSARARGEPTRRGVWYRALPPLGLAGREVTEPTRRTAVGDAGLCAAYGDAARGAGSVVEE